MNLANFIQQTLTRKDHLFIAIYRFNELISLYIDESHLRPFPELRNNWGLLKNVPRVQRKLSKVLQRLFQLEGRPYYYFEEPRLRLVLMEGEVLKELLIKVGAVYYADWIGKVIVKKEVLDLKESIGNDVYFFATKKAALIKGLAPKIEVPEVPRLTKEELMGMGKLCMELCFSGESREFTERLALRLPSFLRWNFEQPVAEGVKMQAWKFLHRLLLKEINPELEVCFT